MINNRSILVTLCSVCLVAAIGGSSIPAAGGQAYKAKLSKSRAEAIALKKYRGGKVQGKTALENEEGKWEYAVMVRAGHKTHEVMVNADTGKIDSEEVVTAKEEAAEQKAETAKKHSKQHTTK